MEIGGTESPGGRGKRRTFPLLPQLSAPSGGRLGDRVLRGLAAYVAAGGDRQMVRVYTLLGDPGLALGR